MSTQVGTPEEMIEISVHSFVEQRPAIHLAQDPSIPSSHTYNENIYDTTSYVVFWVYYTHFASARTPQKCLLSLI